MSTKSYSPGERCQDVAELLPLVSHGLLDEQDSARVRAHLADCESCQSLLASYEQADAALEREFVARQRAAPAWSRGELARVLCGRRVPFGREQSSADPEVPGTTRSSRELVRVVRPASRSRRFFSTLAALLTVMVLVALAAGLFNASHGLAPLSPSGNGQSASGGGRILPGRNGMVPADLSHVNLKGLFMLSATEGWAVGVEQTHGARGVIFHDSDGQWSQVSAVLGAGTLWSIAMLSASDGWIVGDGGLILHYDGQSWQAMASPVKSNLSAIFMLSATDGWAMGTDILHYSQGSWTRVGSAPGLIYQIQMLSASDGWAVGPAGILHYNQGAWMPVPFGDMLKGPHWKTQPNDTLQAQPLSLSMSSTSDGWAVGPGQANLLHYQQGQWQLAPSPNPAANLQAVAMVAPGDGWAMGVDTRTNHGVIYHYLHGQWSSVTSPTNQTVLHLFMLSPAEGWAVGTGATILHYSQGAWSVALR